MPQDQLDALIARLASDPTFAASLAAATTVADAQQIAAKHGFDVTTAELTAATSSDTLSDADLGGVAGGGHSRAQSGLRSHREMARSIGFNRSDQVSCRSARSRKCPGWAISSS